MENNKKPVRIGILTFHKSINYGAFLQCYALSTNIKSAFPEAQVEVIDYCPEFEIKKYEVSLKSFVFGTQFIRYSFKGIIKNIAKLILMPDILKQGKQLNNAFYKAYEHLPKSEKQWVTDDYKKFWAEAQNDYDIVIVGSDAVWEFKVFPFPSAYFIENDVDVRKMSYAACSGRMSVHMTTPEQQKALGKIWSDFKYIGVRDNTTKKFIDDIVSGLEIHHNCDPSFILDLESSPLFDREKVKNILIKNGIDPEKPIIGIMGGNEMGKMIRKFWGDKYQVVAVFYPNRYADAYLSELTPFEWAVVFSFFKVTFTRFFHGTIFSLKNGTPTVSIDDWFSDGKEQLSKLQDVLIRTNLTNHYFRIEEMRTEEGRKRIKEAAEEFINNPDTLEISEGLKRESECFQEFKAALASQINEVRECTFNKEG